MSYKNQPSLSLSLHFFYTFNPFRVHVEVYYRFMTTTTASVQQSTIDLLCIIIVFVFVCTCWSIEREITILSMMRIKYIQLNQFPNYIVHSLAMVYEWILLYRLSNWSSPKVLQLLHNTCKPIRFFHIHEIKFTHDQKFLINNSG